MYIMIFLLMFISVVVFTMLFLLYRRKSRNIPANNIADTNYTPDPFKLVAAGSALAFFPSVVGILIGLLSAYLGIRIFSNNFFYPFLMGLLVQTAGAFIMTLGFLYLYRWSRTMGRKSAGLIPAIIGSALGLLMNFKILVSEFFYGTIGGFKIDLLAFLIISTIMSVACLILSRSYTRFKFLGISFGLLAVIIFLIYWGPGSFLENYNSISFLFSFIIYGYGFGIILAPLLELVFFAQTIFSLRILGAKLRVDTTNQESKVTAESCKVEPLVSANSSTDNGDILVKLMGYDDAWLRKIVDNPKFHSAAVVDKARELLARREAWELIKDLPDEELLEMTMADMGLYDPNIVEAASMELYQRDSRLLREQFMALTPDTVSAIAAGDAPAPEGIRLAARKMLSETTRR